MGTFRRGSTTNTRWVQRVGIGICFPFVVLGCSKGHGTATTDAGSTASSSIPGGGTNEERAAAALKQYMAPIFCMDRLSFVANPEGDRAAMAAYYKTKVCDGEYESIDASDCKYPLDDGYCGGTVTFKDKTSANYCMAKTELGFKVDWRCSVAYSPVTLPAFRAEHALRRPSIFRLRAKLDDYYGYEYADARQTHYSIDLEDEDRASISAYVPRNSPDGQKLFESLKDGQRRSVLIELAYNSNSGSRVATITRLIGFTWRERPEEYGR